MTIPRQVEIREWSLVITNVSGVVEYMGKK